MNSITITAYAESSYDLATSTSAVHYDRPQSVEFHADFDSADDAAAFVALFPKSSKFRAHSVSGPDADGRYSVVFHRANTRIGLSSNDARGEKNETGIKRYHAIIKRAAALGLTVEWNDPERTLNAYSTREQFEAVI